MLQEVGAHGRSRRPHRPAREDADRRGYGWRTTCRTPGSGRDENGLTRTARIRAGPRTAAAQSGGVPPPAGVRWRGHAAREAGDTREGRSGAAPATASGETDDESLDQADYMIHLSKQRIVSVRTRRPATERRLDLISISRLEIKRIRDTVRLHTKPPCRRPAPVNFGSGFRL